MIQIVYNPVRHEHKETKHWTNTAITVKLCDQCFLFGHQLSHQNINKGNLQSLKSKQTHKLHQIRTSDTSWISTTKCTADRWIYHHYCHIEIKKIQEIIRCRVFLTFKFGALSAICRQIAERENECVIHFRLDHTQTVRI